MTDVRQIALTLLDEYEASGKYINLSLSSHHTDHLGEDGRASLTALLYTAVEHKLTYDYYIGAISGRQADSLDMHTRNILRLGLCQIFDMRSIPDFAAVNETVSLGRNKGERSLVNAVLRAAVNRKNDPPMPPKEKNYRRYLSVKYSYPLWIVKLLDAAFGTEMCESILCAMNSDRYTDITVNTLRTDVDALLSKLADAGVKKLEKHDTGMGIRIGGSVNPEKLPGFAEGEFFVQDKACLVSAIALSPTANSLVVDTCACPGGKSFAASLLMMGAGRVVSLDLHESKLSLITEGAGRLGLKNIDAGLCDARSPRAELLGRADRVICDVPCSGLGVLGKKPDLRYKSETDAKALPELQLEILTASSGYLAPGGILLYSTCTLNPAENRQVVDAFLAEHPEFYLEPFSVGLLRAEDGTLTLTPHTHHTDGFYMARIRKRNGRDKSEN